MPVSIIAALALPFLAGGMMGRANVMQQQAKDAQKAQEGETKQLMALGESLSQGKGGDADVQALQALSHRFAAIPNGQQFFDSFMTRAQGISMQKATQQAMMAQMFGLEGGPSGPSPQPGPSLTQQVAQQRGSQGDGTSLTPQGVIQAGLPPAAATSQPFTGQVGAIPQPQPGVQSAQPGIPATRPASQAGVENMRGLNMANAQPTDMSTAIQRLDTSIPAPSPGRQAQRPEDLQNTPEYQAVHDARAVPTGNFAKVDKALGGEFSLGNISLNNRPVQIHDNGRDYSSLESITIEQNGRHILIPTVLNGRLVSDEQAIQHFRQTGQHHWYVRLGR